MYETQSSSLEYRIGFFVVNSQSLMKTEFVFYNKFTIVNNNYTCALYCELLPDFGSIFSSRGGAQGGLRGHSAKCRNQTSVLSSVFDNLTMERESTGPKTTTEKIFVEYRKQHSFSTREFQCAGPEISN